jgi:hypothetical protein
MQKQNQRKKQESQLERHVCKICGQKMSPDKCILHKDATGHHEFKPEFNEVDIKLEREIQLKGGKD